MSEHSDLPPQADTRTPIEERYDFAYELIDIAEEAWLRGDKDNAERFEVRALKAIHEAHRTSPTIKLNL